MIKFHVRNEKVLKARISWFIIKHIKDICQSIKLSGDNGWARRGDNGWDRDKLCQGRRVT